VFGLTHLRRAAVFLSAPGGEVPSSDDLAEACHCVWQALRFADLWPEEIRDRAAELIVLLLRHGPYQETARRMAAQEAREFSGLVQSLVAVAEKRGTAGRPSESGRASSAVEKRAPSTPRA